MPDIGAGCRIASATDVSIECLLWARVGGLKAVHGDSNSSHAHCSVKFLQFAEPKQLLPHACCIQLPAPTHS